MGTYLIGTILMIFLLYAAQNIYRKAKSGKGCVVAVKKIGQHESKYKSSINSHLYKSNAIKLPNEKQWRCVDLVYMSPLFSLC